MYINSIFHRTSVRQYLDKDVEQKKSIRFYMLQWLHHQQPWEYYVVRNKVKLQELALTSPYVGSAAKVPMEFNACYRKNCMMPEYAQIDLSASVQNVLEADELELGAVRLGIAPLQDLMDTVRKVLDIPE